MARLWNPVWACCFGLLGNSACVAYSRIPDAANVTVPASHALEVWQAGERTLLRGVTISADSIWGTLDPESTGCRDCRIALPRQALDSVRVARGPGAGGVIIGGTLAVVGFLVWYGHQMAGD